MEQELINTLLSGVTIFRIGREYIFAKPPSAEVKAFADFFASEVYEDCILEGMLREDDVLELLGDLGVWSDKEEEELSTRQNALEQMKLDYFNQFQIVSRREYIQDHIEKQVEALEKLYGLKGSLHDKTCEYARRYTFSCKIAEQVCFLEGGDQASKIFPVPLLTRKLGNVVFELQSRAREVAKSSKWRNLWHGPKETAFNNSPSSFTDAQLSLISWSHFYDGVGESMEKPTAEVIEDDLALDGWAIQQNRKRKDEEAKKRAEGLISDKTQGAGEVLIPVRNAQEAKDVSKLNTEFGRSKINSLHKDLKKHGAVKESDLSSTRKEINMAAANARRK